MPHKPSLRLGSVAKRSGQYQQIGSRAGRGKEITITGSEPLVPTPKTGTSYTLVDPTENKSG